MTDPEPMEVRVHRGGEVKYKYPRFYGPPLRLRVIGPGWVKEAGIPRKVQNQVKHSEYWTGPNKDGISENRVPKRKNKRDFPELPALPSGSMKPNPPPTDGRTKRRSSTRKKSS